jgi:exosortase
MTHAATHSTSGSPAAERWLHAAILLASALLCVPALSLLSSIWNRSEFYAHGYLIPPVAALLLWQRRADVGAALRTAEPPVAGWVALLAVASFEVLMVIGDVGFAAAVTIPVLLGTAAWAIGGAALLRPLLLPLGFLALMVPPPRFVTYEALSQLKLLVTKVSVALLQATGQTISARGNEIFVPGHSLFVADACSGLTSIVTLIPLACIVAYFLSHGLWRRAVLLAAVVPLAVTANVVRVVATVHLVSARGIEWAQGTLHDSFGMMTYLGGTLALIALAKVLR